MAKRSKIVDRVAQVVNGDRQQLAEGTAERPAKVEPEPNAASLEQRMMKNLALIRSYEADDREHQGKLQDSSVAPAA